MLSDFQFALRQLRKSPGFALTAILTLALGIGVNTAIFSLVDSILLEPLPFPHQARLMRIIGYGPHERDASPFPKGWIRALGEHSNSFAEISGFGVDAESNVGEANSPNRVFGAEVMANALSTLDIRPALGRFFTADDAMAGHDPVVVLSYGYWKEHFGANPAVIGQSIRIDGISRQIIGVMPKGIRFPYADTQFLTPVTFKGGDPFDPWNNFNLEAFGRLKDGVTPAQAQAELRTLRKLLLPMFPWRMPDSWASETAVVPLLDSIVGNMRARLLLLFGAVGLVLLIACANVANLMLARAASREREIAIRGALGASGGRLIKQLLSESVLIGLLAGTAGLMAAPLSLRLMTKLLPADTPRLNDLGLHWHAFLFAAGISVLTGLLFGLVPAWRMASPNLQSTLQSGSRGAAGSVSHFRTAMLLVIGQIGLTVVVITAAGLLLHSLYRLSQVNPGFRTERIVTAEVSMDSNACAQKGRCLAFFQTLLDRAPGIPGTENVALTDSLPLSGRDNNYVYDAQGHPRVARMQAFLATEQTVSPGYFATLGMQLMHGRLLDDQDASGASRAAVINEHMANHLWPHQDPLGKHIISVNQEPEPGVLNPNTASIVVGVVANAHEVSLAGNFGDEVFLPVSRTNEQPVMYVLLRTRATTQQATDALRQMVAEIDPQVPVTRVRTLNEVVTASESAPRSLTVLLLGFGILAVVIGAVGVYSLIAYIVSWRTKEIGIRLALGAPRWTIVRQIVTRSVTLAAGGSALGLIAAAVSARLLHSFLFGISPLDPITFVCVPVLMVLLAVAAAWIPARRAAGIQPIEALRVE
ncbi:MAG TPA: ABC transporter permease [Acidobacteriaceae bacterium]|nr:ABC transporter permease [Acidobacteriaceae bacterium]